MKELEKIIGTYYADGKCPEYTVDQYDYTVQDVKDIAIAYAKVCLEKAAEEATCKTKVTPIKKDGFIEGYTKTAIVDKESIINIELQ